MTAIEKIRKIDPVKADLRDEIYKLEQALDNFLTNVAKSKADLSDVATFLPDHWTNRVIIAQKVANRRNRIEAWETFGA
jgi:hypothetical protein